MGQLIGAYGYVNRVESEARDLLDLIKPKRDAWGMDNVLADMEALYALIEESASIIKESLETLDGLDDNLGDIHHALEMASERCEGCEDQILTTQEEVGEVSRSIATVVTKLLETQS
jgi:methyl-accepting chemotaxis protein